MGGGFEDNLMWSKTSTLRSYVVVCGSSQGNCFEGDSKFEPGEVNQNLLTENMKDRATRFLGTFRSFTDCHPVTSPFTSPYGFLDRSRQRVRIKPAHDFVRVLRTYWRDIDHRWGPVDHIPALLRMFPTKWMPTPSDLHKEP